MIKDRRIRTGLTLEAEEIKRWQEYTELYKKGREGNGTPLQYFGHLMRKVDSLEKTLMLGGIGGRRRRG